MDVDLSALLDMILLGCDLKSDSRDPEIWLALEATGLLRHSILAFQNLPVDSSAFAGLLAKYSSYL